MIAAAPLRVEDLSVRYGPRTALDAVTFAVVPGSVYALLGLNGAGKSTLVRCLLGQQRPGAGRALLLERDVWRHRAELLGDVGVVSEQPDAPPALSAREIARFCSRVHRRWDGPGFEERLRRFGVPLDLAFGRLSKGQKGQVALSLALAPSPELLVLDDPTLGLDPRARRAVFEELIGELAERGTTVFLTTHELAAVEGIADRVGILRDGRLLVDEDLEALKARFRRLRWTQPGEGLEKALHAFSPVALARRAWGLEVIVSRFDEDAWARCSGPGAAEVEAIRLEDLFLALVSDPIGQRGAA